MEISPSVHQCSAEFVCAPENRALFSTLCNIIEQLPGLFANLNDGNRRLGENRNLSSSADKTFFAPTNRAFSRLSGLFDFKKEVFTQDEKVVLKELIQVHIIGGGVVQTYEELDCNEKLRNLNGKQIQIRCAENRKGIEVKYVVGDPGLVVNFDANSAKITDSNNVYATNGIIHAINNIVWQN